MTAAFVAVARPSEIPPGTVKVVRAGGTQMVVANVDGKLYALENRCSHDDGPLGEGELRGGEIVCPRHGARFDLATGAPTSMPAVVPVGTYPIRIAGDEIQVELR